VLWEIGEAGCDVAALRRRLDLDSGYLSRLLRSLEGAGLVTVGPSDVDRRRRTARLTLKGRSEWATLDARSEDLAQSLLEPLTGPQRERLVNAMSEVERLLTAALVEVAPVDPADPMAQLCVQAYFAELGRRFDTGFDATKTRPAGAEELRPPAGVFLVATLHGEPVGCGGLKLHRAEPAEVKRMWVAPSVRGLGVGRRLLTELERRAAEAGHGSVRLDTNGALTEAIAMYRNAGYHEIPAFNDEPYAHHWFEKDLDRR
jgi:DNA-binding MarR family transcriptional regulator/GNAT superfamily N-acetyltransferase